MSLIESNISRTGFSITEGILNNTQPGQIFKYNSGSYFVLHRAGFGSIVNCNNEDYNGFIDLIMKPNVPQYFHVYDASDSLINVIKHESKYFNFKLRSRSVYRYLNVSINKLDLPKGFSVAELSRENYFNVSSSLFNLENKYWMNSNELIQNANGFVVYNERHEPVSICYSVATVDKIAEIDVFTSDNSRAKGLAKIAVQEFINTCIRKKEIPNWDCFDENISSVNTALSLGFQKHKTYNLLSIYKTI